MWFSAKKQKQLKIVLEVTKVTDSAKKVIHPSFEVIFKPHFKTNLATPQNRDLATAQRDEEARAVFHASGGSWFVACRVLQVTFKDQLDMSLKHHKSILPAKC